MGQKSEYDFSRTPNIDTILRGIDTTYGTELRRYIKRTLDADAVDDVYQKLLIRVAIHYHKYDPEKAKLRTWLYVITKNLIRNSLRNNARERGVFSHDPLDEGDRTIEERVGREYDLLTEDDYAQMLEERMKLLAPEHREVIELQMIKGLSYDAIAAQLGVDIGTVRSRRHRAMVVAFPEKIKDGPNSTERRLHPRSRE